MSRTRRLTVTSVGYNPNRLKNASWCAAHYELLICSVSSLTCISDGNLEVLVVRSDLNMSTGKVAAQHATLACYKALSQTNPSLLRHWERTGQTKIALRCDSEDEMLLLQAQAQSLNICARSIQDAGRTQIAAGSRTVLGIGPAPVRLVNQVTGLLRLL
ncbi:peptidyl-tRNA hydrolase PTH2-domain-containing protein [Russula vinacea]|nr:peptidyl-tRNA hydrolase PTH2-domain-containing protein [Russula vinacea]